MALQFVHKRFLKRSAPVVVKPAEPKKEVVKAEPKEEAAPKPKNKKVKKETNMLKEEQIAAAEETVEMIAPEVKRVKKDRGLIERTESSKIILTEDNRQVLND